MSKEEDNPKKSKSSEVFKKYKYSKGNDKINSTSHVQPVNTYNNLRKNFNKRGLKSTLASSPIFLQKLSATAATKESNEKETMFQKCDQDNHRQNGIKSRITNDPNILEVFTDDGELENMTDYQFNSNKAGTKTASSHLGMHTDYNGIVLLDEKEMIVDIWNEVNKSDDDKSGGYTSASVRETSKPNDISYSKHVVPKSFEYINISGERRKHIRIVKYKDKKDSVHTKKKVTTTNANLPVLATTNTKISCSGRKTTSTHQQKQDSTQINQLVIETTEKTAENHSTGKVDSSNSINIFHVEDTSSRKKLFQVDESNTKQDIPQKNYSNK